MAETEEYDPYPLANAVWNAILDAIDSEQLPLTYGWLSELFYGHEHSGQVFGYPLGNIHYNIKRYNRRHKLGGRERIPFLNELVVRTDTLRPGSGAPGIPANVKTLIREVNRITATQLRSIGEEIGYDPGVGYKEYSPRRVRDDRDTDRNPKAISFGPFKGGIRTQAVFEARHAPIVESLRAKLERHQWRTVRRTATNENPDLVVERKGRKILFEVKSGCDVHSLICAVGQCKVYDLKYQTDRQIIIALSDDNILDGNVLWVFDALHELKIEFVFAYRRGKLDFDFRFEKRDELVTRLR